MRSVQLGDTIICRGCGEDYPADQYDFEDGEYCQDCKEAAINGVEEEE